MLNTFKNNLIKLQLYQPELKWLLAVSGGIDSMVMMHLFKSLNFQVGIAHCNFQLRGTDSDKDEELVRQASMNANFPFFSVRFNTEEVAQEKGISIQMAARELRYHWFGEIRNEENYDLVALAHNRDDVLETFFVNLARGTGIKGLTGMAERRDTWVRPLLYASRSMIMKYQEEKQIQFREDSSNATLKYLRNRIRHIIIPEMEKLNPAFREHLIHTIDHLDEVQHSFQAEYEELKKNIIHNQRDTILINIEKLRDLENPGSFLFEFLREYQFNSSTVDNILKSMKGPSGKIFFSPSHRIIKDRENFVITLRKKDNKETFFIDFGLEKLDQPVKLIFRWSVLSGKHEISRNNFSAILDESLLKFPLTLRKWQDGDRFFPLGMDKPKKLSNFFIDLKLSLPEKENTWLLCSGDQIVWVVGYRIDSRFKITDKTIKWLEIEFQS